MAKFNHSSLTVLDVARSVAFYREALGLIELNRKEIPARGERPGRTLVYMGDGATTHQLELTQIAGHTEPYRLGDNGTHVALSAGDFDAMCQKHKAMGIVDFENPVAGIYFIHDPDGYAIEIMRA